MSLANKLTHISHRAQVVSVYERCEDNAWACIVSWGEIINYDK